MLINFTVGNFLSFKEKQTISLEAANFQEHIDDNCHQIGEKFFLLKSIAIYGANASGKTNLLKAMHFVRDFVFSSSKEMQATESINISRFELSTETDDQPSHFEIVFLYQNQKYRYGFELDEKIVYREWLYYTPTTKEAKLFTRDNNGIELGTHFKEGKGLGVRTRPNALFLSVVAQFNGEISTNVIEWFNNFNIISGLYDEIMNQYSFNKFLDIKYKEKISNFLNLLDTGIEALEVVNIKFIENQILKGLPKELKKLLLENEGKQLFSVHKKYDKQKKIVESVRFNMSDHESKGTCKLFSLFAPLFEVLENGETLVVDELEARLHTFLTQTIIKLFNNEAINNKGAQLIFMTHDTNILNSELLRRDQIWFTQKDNYGETILNPLTKFKPRNDLSFSKKYQEKAFQAVPEVDFNSITKLFIGK